SSFKRRPEIFVFFYSLAMSAECDSIGSKIRILQIGGADPARIVFLLVHAYRTVHAVVKYKHDNIQTILDCSGELLTMHEKATVASKAHDLSFRHDAFGPNGCGCAVAHGAGSRG